jgi:four helix bundle protein
MKIENFKDLEVWKNAVKLSKMIYSSTKEFPKEELYGLTNQMRRASVSIASNIAEGKDRQSTNEYIHFLHIAKGSCAELETQTIISAELNYLSVEVKEELLDKIDHIKRMLINLIKGLKAYK